MRAGYKCLQRPGECAGIDCRWNGAAGSLAKSRETVRRRKQLDEMSGLDIESTAGGVPAGSLAKSRETTEQVRMRGSPSPRNYKLRRNR